MTLLCYADIDFKKYRQFLKKYKLEHFSERLKEIINSFREIECLSLNPREFKSRKQKILSKFKKIYK